LQEDDELDKVLNSFVDDFDAAGAVGNKSFVRGGVVNPDAKTNGTSDMVAGLPHTCSVFSRRRQRV
jgi:hypothetical protein